MKKKIKSYAPARRNPARPLKKIYVSYQEFHDGKSLDTLAADSFGLVLFENGAGLHIAGDTNYKVKDRQLHIISPDLQQVWQLKPPVKGQLLVIKKDLIEAFSAALQFPFSEHNTHTVLDLDTEAYQKINTEFSAVKKELSATTLFQELVNARCRLIVVMIHLWMEHQFGDITLNQPNALLHKFHSLLEKHYKTQKSVAFYARHLCITSNYLGIICRKHYGMSPLELIQERILLEAKRLLHSTDRSVKTVAFELGFRNQTYFAYFFKNKTSLTPKAYKELLDIS